MFLKLTSVSGKNIFINFDKVREFEKCDHNDAYTTITKEYGVTLVIESPEEIMEMLKEARG